MRPCHIHTKEKINNDNNNNNANPETDIQYVGWWWLQTKECWGFLVVTRRYLGKKDSTLCRTENVALLIPALQNFVFYTLRE